MFGLILDSSVWDTPPPVTKVWVTMMAMADRDGKVHASIPGLAIRARVSRRIAEKALSLFLSPDPDSRTPDAQGRRIEAIDGGWRLLNHSKYREMDSVADRREKTAERVRRHREKKRNEAEKSPVTESNASNVIRSEADPKAETDPEASTPPWPGPPGSGFRSSPRVYLAAATPSYLSVEEAYPNGNRARASQAFAELAAAYDGGEVKLSADILGAFRRGFLKRHPYDSADLRFRPLLENIIAERRWEQPFPEVSTAKSTVPGWTDSEYPE